MHSSCQLVGALHVVRDDDAETGTISSKSLVAPFFITLNVLHQVNARRQLQPSMSGRRNLGYYRKSGFYHATVQNVRDL